MINHFREKDRDRRDRNAGGDEYEEKVRIKVEPPDGECTELKIILKKE